MASKEGPPGCNLFIYHIPPSWTDDDLRKKFQGYGNMSLSQTSLPALSIFHSARPCCCQISPHSLVRSAPR